MTQENAIAPFNRFARTGRKIWKALDTLDRAMAADPLADQTRHLATQEFRK